MANCRECGVEVGFAAQLCPACFEKKQNPGAVPAPRQEQVSGDAQVRPETVNHNTGIEPNAPIPTKYGTARGVAVFGELIGWFLTIFGIVLVTLALTKDVGLTGVASASAISIAGLYLVMMGQFVRATLDNADNTREICRLLDKRQ